MIATIDCSENERRIQDENERLERYEALQIEAVTSGRKNAAVEMKWAELLAENVAQVLAEKVQILVDHNKFQLS